MPALSCSPPPYPPAPSPRPLQSSRVWSFLAKRARGWARSAPSSLLPWNRKTGGHGTLGKEKRQKETGEGLPDASFLTQKADRPVALTRISPSRLPICRWRTLPPNAPVQPVLGSCPSIWGLLFQLRLRTLSRQSVPSFISSLMENKKRDFRP